MNEQKRKYVQDMQIGLTIEPTTEQANDPDHDGNARLTATLKTYDWDEDMDGGRVYMSGTIVNNNLDKSTDNMSQAEQAMIGRYLCLRVPFNFKD